MRTIFIHLRNLLGRFLVTMKLPSIYILCLYRITSYKAWMVWSFENLLGEKGRLIIHRTWRALWFISASLSLCTLAQLRSISPAHSPVSVSYVRPSVRLSQCLYATCFSSRAFEYRSTDLAWRSDAMATFWVFAKGFSGRKNEMTRIRSLSCCFFMFVLLDSLSPWSSLLVLILICRLLLSYLQGETNGIYIAGRTDSYRISFQSTELEVTFLEAKRKL